MTSFHLKSEPAPRIPRTEEIPVGMAHEHPHELCALATTGTLTEQEWGELKSHLSSCAECAALLQKYREVARTGMPLLISESAIEDHAGLEAWTPERAHQDLMARLARGEQSGWSQKRSPRQSSEEMNFWIRLRVPTRRVALRYAAAFILAAAVTGAIYRSGMERGQTLARTGFSPEATLHAQIDGLKQERAVLDDQLTGRTREIEALSKQVETASTDFAKLRSLQKLTEQDLQQRSSELSESHAQNNATVAEREAMAHKLAEADSALASMKASLDQLREERTAGLLHTASLETRIAELSARLKQQGDLGDQDAQLLASDRDIRELMGARDLYIADVFDVDPEGRTQKPFGRVFYTRGKSLIFYAFDLDKQHGLRNASTFQAWGRQGRQDQHPVNMGIFYLDNEANRRWVLKFNDPETLARIDTVFVTVEPKGGSHEPRGKFLLIASLRSEPNHP